MKLSEEFKEIERRYAAESVFSRLRKLLGGINAKKDSKEWKEAQIELQRLSAPFAAIVLPVLAVIVLMMMSNGEKENDLAFETQVMEAETIDDLPPPEEIPDTETPSVDTELTIAFDSPSISVDTSIPDSSASVAPVPVSLDSVRSVKSPVMLRSIYGDTRSAGTRGNALKKYGGDANTEACVLRALRWIKSQQQKNGSWKGRGDGTSVTGFAGLAFLAHGEIPGESREFGQCVQRGIEYLMTQPRHDAMATHALAETYGMTRNPNIKQIASRSLNQLADRLADTKWGPARDGDGTTFPNLLNMAFNVLALRSAKLSGIEVAKIDVANRKLREGFLAQANKSIGGFNNDHFGPPGLNYRRTGTWHFIIGVVGMQFLGSGGDPVVAKTLARLDEDWPPPTLGSTDIACCPVRGNYWATMVFFNHGGKRWERWNRGMRETYIAGQQIISDRYTDPDGKPQEMGYWTCEDMHIGEQPLMPTCYVAQQLMVYYRYLPTSSKEVWEAFAPQVLLSANDTEDIEVDVAL